MASALPPDAAKATFYVSPDGNDQWSGRLAQPNGEPTDGPLATLEQARDRLRRLPATTARRVVVGAGRYELKRPFVLDPRDSGTTYEAAPGARPVFSGGQTIRGFQPGDGGIWRTFLPAVAAGDWYFEQLFVDGRRATRARSPNKFYYYLLEVQEEILEPGAGRRPTRARQTATARPEDLQPLFELRESELRDVQFAIYHKWDNTTRFVEAVDPAAAAIVTTGEGRKPWNAWGRSDRYHLENFLAAGKAVEFVGLPLAAWRSRHGHDQRSIVADPLFVDAVNHDFRLRPQSPALALGFQPFDPNQAGVYGDPAWIQQANEVVYPPLEWPPDPPPIPDST